MPSANTYHVQIVYGEAISFETSRIFKTYYARVYFDADATHFVHESRRHECQTPAIDARTQRLLVASLGKTAKSYQRYFDKHGERWEVISKAKRDAVREAKRKANRIAFLQAEIPKLKAELKQLIRSAQQS